MSKNQNASKNQETLAVQVANLRETLKGMGMTPEFIDQQVKALYAAKLEPIRKEAENALMAAGNSVAQSEVIKGNLEVLRGSSFGIRIEVTEKGEVSVISVQVHHARKAGARKSPSNGGKRDKLLLNGHVYDSWNALCKAKGIDVGGDSAKRAYTRANAADPKAYPMPDIAPEETGK